MRVDLLDVLAQLASLFGLDLLYLLEAARLHEGSLVFHVRRQNLGKLGTDVCKDVVWSQVKEWLEGREMGAHLDDVLERLLGLVLQILRTLWKHVNGKESSGHISLSKSLGMVRSVAAYLTERPGSGCLEMVLWLVQKSLLERRNALRNDDSHGQGVVESRDVAESHDAWQSGVAL